LRGGGSKGRGRRGNCNIVTDLFPHVEVGVREEEEERLSVRTATLSNFCQIELDNF